MNVSCLGAPFFERSTVDIVVDHDVPADRLLDDGLADAVTVDHGKVGRLGADKGGPDMILFKAVS